MTPKTLAQALSSADRLEAIANQLASKGALAAAEVCAGAVLSMRLLINALQPPPPPPEPSVAP